MVSYTNANAIVHENLLLSNNMIGATILSANAVNNTRNQANRILIVGQNKENPINLMKSQCGSDCTQIGFVLPTVTSGSGLIPPFNTESFPIHSVKTDAIYGSFFDSTNFTFVNWEDQSEIPSFAISSNSYSSDYTSIQNFYNLVLNSVIER